MDDTQATTDPSTDAAVAAAASDQSAPASAGVGTETTDGDAAELAEVEPDLDPEQRAEEDGRTPGELLVALEAAQAERDEYLDALQRSRAEFDNFRKRASRESTAARTAGMGDLAGRLLDALDDVDRTVQAAVSSTDESLAGGIGAVQRKLADALAGVGIERVDERDVPFDANRHEAVQQVPAAEPLDEPEVAEVLRPGYVLGDRVLRAAMVAVRQ